MSAFLLSSMLAFSMSGIQSRPVEEVRLPLVQVLDSSREPTLKERARAREVTADEFEQIKNSEGLEGFAYKDKAFILIGRDHPMIQPIADEIELMSAMPKAGQPIRFGDLPKPAQAALERTLNSFGLPMGPIPQDAVFLLQANPRYELAVGGQRRTLRIPANQAKGPMSVTREMFGSSSIPSPQSANLRSPVASLALVFPPGAGKRMLRFEVATAAMEKMAEMAMELASKQEKRQAEWLKELLLANKGLMDEVPRGGGRLDQLPEGVRERLQQQFIDGYRAYGYDSEESARAAWESARLVDSYMEFSLTFSYGGSPKNHLSEFVFSRTRG